MPSQDGLKFIEIAREFNYQPAWDVVRSADQHPLYPFLVNRVAAFLRFSPFTSPDLWRISAQLVSVAASLAALWPIFAISRRFAGESACLIAVFVWLLLPLPVALGHETLSDALALCFGLWALEFGLQAAESRVPRFRIYFAAGSAMAVAAVPRPPVRGRPTAWVSDGPADRAATPRRASPPGPSGSATSREHVP